MSFPTSNPGLPQPGVSSAPQSTYGDYNVCHMTAEAANQIVEATEGFRAAMANHLQNKTGTTESGLRLATTNASDVLFNLNKLSYSPGVDIGMTDTDRKVINAAAVNMDNAIQNGLSNGVSLTGVAQTMANLQSWAKTALPPPPPPSFANAGGPSFGAGQTGGAPAFMNASLPGQAGAGDSSGASLSVQVTVNLVAATRATTVADKAASLNAALGALSMQLGGPSTAPSMQPGQSFQTASASASTTASASAPNGAAGRSEASPMSAFLQGATSMLKSVADLVPQLPIPDAAKMKLQDTLSGLTGLLNQLAQISGLSQQIGSSASGAGQFTPVASGGGSAPAPMAMGFSPAFGPPAQTAQAFQSFAPTFTGGLKDVVSQLGTVQDNTQLGVSTGRALDQIADVVGRMNALASKTA